VKKFILRIVDEDTSVSTVGWMRTDVLVNGRSKDLVAARRVEVEER